MNTLKELRLEKDVLQKDVAQYLGIDRTTYVKYERGDSQPNNEMLIKLAEYFDVSVDFLLAKTKIKNHLTKKDEKEITKMLEDVENQLLTQEGLMFDGMPATKEDIEKLLIALKTGTEMIKKQNKEKYTPKKYRT